MQNLQNQYKQVNKKEHFNMNQGNLNDFEKFQVDKQIYNSNFNNFEKLFHYNSKHRNQ